MDLRDPKQFSRAYRAHAGAMAIAAQGVLRDPAAAEDVVQDVFMHLWRKPDAYDPKRGSLGSFLTMMARSRALDRWRTRGAREAALERSKAEQRVPAPAGEDAAEPVIRRDSRVRVLRALESLPGEQREAVLLAFGKGLTAREIASVAGVPLGTVKSRVRLGLAEGSGGADGRSVTDEGLTIREVVKRTGVEAPTLRMWEQRHGFPRPQRLPSGHRRYTPREVDLIARVVRDRESGLELRAAIEAAKRAGEAGRPTVEDESIYAGLRQWRPDVLPYLLPKRTLVGLSHAIEDECSVNAQRAMLFASFQRERFYRLAEERWRDLAAPAERAIVLADFDSVRTRSGAPTEVPVALADPIGREWAVICDAPGFAALLAGWERPGQDGVRDSDRAFETIWSVEPELVRQAARLACSIAERAAPDAVAGVGERLDERVGAQSPRIGTLTNLASRMVAYVGGGSATPLPAPHSSEAG